MVVLSEFQKTLTQLTVFEVFLDLESNNDLQGIHNNLRGIQKIPGQEKTQRRAPKTFVGAKKLATHLSYGTRNFPELSLQ